MATTKPKAKAKPAEKPRPKAKKVVKAPPEKKQTRSLVVMNPKQQRFAEEYIIDLNATAAYKRAGYSGTGNVAESMSSQLLSNIKVKQYIQIAMDKRAERTGITQDVVLQQWASIALADANELTEYRRRCCRFCHGNGFRYQRTQNEMESDREHHERDVLKALESDKPSTIVQRFPERGGTGYDPRKPAHKDCPECFGEGVGMPYIKDTRELSPDARALYAGVKVTKEGVQVMTNSKDKALEMVARHLGMFVEKVEHSGNVTVEMVDFASFHKKK